MTEREDVYLLYHFTLIAVLFGGPPMKDPWRPHELPLPMSVVVFDYPQTLPGSDLDLNGGGPHFKYVDTVEQTG